MMARRVVLGFVILAVFVLVGCGSSRDDADAQPRDDTAQGKYIPDGDEGLGASVAILVDQSGSMREPAGGDSRPKYHVCSRSDRRMLASTDRSRQANPASPSRSALTFCFFLCYLCQRRRTLVPVAPTTVRRCAPPSGLRPERRHGHRGGNGFRPPASTGRERFANTSWS